MFIISLTVAFLSWRQLDAISSIGNLIMRLCCANLLQELTVGLLSWLNPKRNNVLSLVLILLYSMAASATAAVPPSQFASSARSWTRSFSSAVKRCCPRKVRLWLLPGVGNMRSVSSRFFSWQLAEISRITFIYRIKKYIPIILPCKNATDPAGFIVFHNFGLQRQPQNCVQAGNVWCPYYGLRKYCSSYCSKWLNEKSILRLSLWDG